MDSLKIAKGLELVSSHIFRRILRKKISFVILHKQVQFNYLIKFTSQVIQ